MDEAIPEPEFGPAMRALTEKQRAFVLAMVSQPYGNATRWARAAGYRNSEGGMRVKGHELLYHAKIRAAAFEVAQGRLNALGPILAVEGLLRVAAKPSHKKHLQAVELLADRVGFEGVTRLVHEDRSDAAVLERIKQLAATMGLDAAKLIGANAEPKLIEGHAVEAGHEIAGRASQDA